MNSLSPQPIKILLVDDHKIVRAGLRMLIESYPELMVTGEASNETEALAEIQHEPPDIVLLDLDLGGDTSLELIPAIRAVSPTSRILILTGLRNVELHHRAIRLGAVSLVMKEQAIEDLTKAIAAISAGELWSGPKDTEGISHDLPHEKPEKPEDDLEKSNITSLTKRERQIIKLVCEGMKNQEIADSLLVSEGTIRNHLTVIFQKLSLSGRFELIVFANRHALDKE